MSEISAQKPIKLISLNIKYLVFVVYSIEFKLKRICKSLYSVFIDDVLRNILTSLQLFFFKLCSFKKDNYN